MLNLINENIGHLPRYKTLFDVGVQRRRIAKRKEIEILQVDGNDLVFFHPICPQIILVDLQQSGLPAASNAGYDFDQLLIPKADQLIQIIFSI